MPMAARLYYADSFMRSFSATVMDVRELAHAGGESVWQVALDRTAFYPTSGGQPFDTGVLRATSRGGATLEIPVLSVEEDEQGEIWHAVTKPLAAGTCVEAEIDWERRLDHMQQHTGQHLLSAVFLGELHMATVSFHMGEAVSTIDLDGGPVAAHSLERVERAINLLIAEDRPVSVSYVARAEADAMLAAGDLRKLPDRSGEIRIVTIAECDRNACGGTHLRSTGQIGGLLLRRIEKVSRGTRVEFVCGLRAVRAARADSAVLAQLTAAASVPSVELPAALERMRREAKQGLKERQRLREELADYHASRLAVEVPIEGGLRLVERCWQDRDPEYIRLLGLRLAAAAPRTAAVLCAEGALNVEGMASARIVIARSLDFSFDCGRLMKDALASHGLRGGGSPDLAQADVPLEHAAALRGVLIQAIRAALAASEAPVSS